MTVPTGRTQDNHRLANWQEEEILATADAFFGSLLQGLASARDSIDMDYYIFEEDTIGRQVIAALIAAAQRGVRVRVMIDGWGSMFSASGIAARLSTAGVAVQVFHPFPFTPHLFRWSNQPGNRFEQFLHFFRMANHRNHHKLCIIDHQQLWTGSFNISAQHLGKDQGGNNWHDYGVRITDDNLGPITESFNHLFTRKNFTRKDFSGKRLYLQKIRSNLTETLRRISNNLLVLRIRTARHRLWICNAYFSPSPRVLRAICRARQKGVDVRIILPRVSDVFFMPLLSRSYYPKLLEEGVELYEYEPGILHAKLMLIDDLCLMGSTNLNHRSFLHDLELDIMLSKPASIDRITRLLETDMQLSRRITRQDLQWGVSLLLGRLLRIFRYWL